MNQQLSNGAVKLIGQLQICKTIRNAQTNSVIQKSKMLKHIVMKCSKKEKMLRDSTFHSSLSSMLNACKNKQTSIILGEHTCKSTGLYIQAKTSKKGVPCKSFFLQHLLKVHKSILAWIAWGIAFLDPNHIIFRGQLHIDKSWLHNRESKKKKENQQEEAYLLTAGVLSMCATLVSWITSEPWKNTQHILKTYITGGY